MGRSVGIDLGTTYTAVAYVDDYGLPVIIKNSDGQITTPSAVFFDAPAYVVGEVALQSTLTEPERVVQFVKRFMGVREHRVRVGGQTYSPEFVSSLILRKVVQEAEAALDEVVDAAVITVPAYFGEAERQATFEAGQLAGLQVLRIINEPTAAALSYGVEHHDAPRRVLVYDLGGGTFDVSVLHISNRALDVLAVGGDPLLGGKDWDDRIMNFIESEVRAKYGFELEEDTALEAELRLKAEAAKRQLSGRQSVPITFKARRHDPVEGAELVPIRVDLTREKFERETSDLLERTAMLLDKVLADANLEWPDIAQILCVGGSSRMPMVREMLKNASGQKVLLHDPDECVAKGAALQAAFIQADASVAPMEVGHVLPHSIGVAAIREGQMMVDHIIPALTPLPCTQTRDGYTTTFDLQPTVEIEIYEGESTDCEAHPQGPVGTISLDVSPPRPAGAPNISVEFRCDENGRIVALARDLDTGQENRTLIAMAGERSEEEVAEESRLMSEAIIS
jgi:molecular chaperone DnaK